jgi:hypothetical protein
MYMCGRGLLNTHVRNMALLRMSHPGSRRWRDTNVTDWGFVDLQKAFDTEFEFFGQNFHLKI